MPKVSQSDYRALAAFRYEIRKFLAFSEQAARRAGLEPQQHQLLLAVQGLPVGTRPTIRAAAERLCVQHHTTVGIVDKLEAKGLVKRERSQADKREVLLHLTEEGLRMLSALSESHREELQRSGPNMVTVLDSIVRGKRSRGTARASTAR